MSFTRYHHGYDKCHLNFLYNYVLKPCSVKLTWLRLSTEIQILHGQLFLSWPQSDNNNLKAKMSRWLTYANICWRPACTAYKWSLHWFAVNIVNFAQLSTLSTVSLITIGLNKAMKIQDSCSCQLVSWSSAICRWHVTCNHKIPPPCLVAFSASQYCSSPCKAVAESWRLLVHNKA